MHNLTGTCHCTNILATLELTASPETIHPRACDCDFCRKHQAAFISDPNGSLTIQINNANNVSRYRQGSGQAEFLICRTCGVLVAVLLNDNGHLYGTVNARAFLPGATFAPDRPVSPKKLTGEEKLKRWQDVWFANVQLK